MVKSEKKRDETLRVEAKRLKGLPSVKKLRFFRTSRLTVFFHTSIITSNKIRCIVYKKLK